MYVCVCVSWTHVRTGLYFFLRLVSRSHVAIKNGLLCTPPPPPSTPLLSLTFLIILFVCAPSPRPFSFMCGVCLYEEGGLSLSPRVEVVCVCMYSVCEGVHVRLIA